MLPQSLRHQLILPHATQRATEGRVEEPLCEEVNDQQEHAAQTQVKGAVAVEIEVEDIRKRLGYARDAIPSIYQRLGIAGYGPKNQAGRDGDDGKVVGAQAP